MIILRHDINNSDGQTNAWYILEGSSICPGHRTLKLMKVKCNPTNKKWWPQLKTYFKLIRVIVYFKRLCLWN